MGRMVGIKLSSEEQKVLLDTIAFRLDYWAERGEFTKKDVDGKLVPPSKDLTKEQKEKISMLLHMQSRVMGEDTIRRPPNHVGQNDKCPCGSGRKFKKCCNKRR